MRWILLLALLFAAAFAEGQERFQSYTTDNGLPNNSVLAILPARDGYLWFTTYGGIVRFDGVRFQVFDESNTPAIHGTTFAAFSLFEDHQGALWAGSWNGGAIRYKNGTFSSITTKDGLPNNRVIRVDEDEQGTIWIFTDPGLSRFRNGRVEAVQSMQGEPVQSYLEKPQSLGGDTHLFGLWRIGRGRSGLQRFAYGRWSDVPLPQDVRNPATIRIEVTLEDSQRRLWFRIIGRPRDSFCVKDGHLTIFKGLPTGAFANYQDRLGRLWITDLNGHTALWQAGRATPLSGLSTSSPLRVVEDSEGSFWVGTLNQGLAHATRQAITSVRLPGGSEANTIRPLIQGQRGDIWIGSYGLTRMHAGRFQTYFLPRSFAKWPADQVIWSLWMDADGTIFLSNNGGVETFRQGSFQKPDRPLDRIKTRVNAIIRDQAGNLWMGNDEGLFLYRDSKLTLFNPEKGLRGEVRALAEDQTGTLWIGTDEVLCRFRNGALSCFGPGDELSHWRIRSITVDGDNVVWAATAKLGLLRVEGDSFRWIQAKDGLFTNTTGAILEDANGYFWIGSHLGIFRVKKQDLNAFASGRLNRVTSSFFGKSDGLNASDSTGYGQPHGFVAKDGTLWFPTADGLANINPKAVAFNNSPPRLQIESCLVDRRPISVGEPVKLKPTESTFEIQYTAFSNLNPERIRFRYKLDGLDRDWIDAGSRRTAYYSHVPGGKYTFRVIAANADGVWNTSDSSLAITVLPRFYDTWWFRVLSFAGAIFLVYFAVRYRVSQLKRANALQHAFSRELIASQESERKRIAAELHDSIGQRLVVIKNLALFFLREYDDTAIKNGKVHLIKEISDEAGLAADESREISYNLRPFQLDRLGLSKAIEGIVRTISSASTTRFSSELDNIDDAFPEDLRINFYRIVQESLNNIVKHAQATEASISVKRTVDRVTLTIRDNGTGFTPQSGRSEATPELGRSGFGRTGMAERARLLGGELSVQTAPDRGTVVSLQIRSGRKDHG
jgi:signal transduction histidine kinase/ligand-binding sensor domain-containing protein